MDSPQLSIITWDGGFRESFHLVDFILKQEASSADFEFLWCDFYGQFAPELQQKVNKRDNCHAHSVGGQEQWHVGKILNSGAQAAKADLLLFLDGDVAFSHTFITDVLSAYQNLNNHSAIYFFRYEEERHAHSAESRSSMTHLQKVCKLLHPENNGAGLLISRQLFERVRGYETHDIFGGPGAINKDMYIRILNSGATIRWEPNLLLYHPWHPGTLPPSMTYKQLAQAHVLNQRRKRRSAHASKEEIDAILESYKLSTSTQAQMAFHRAKDSVRRLLRRK